MNELKYSVHNHSNEANKLAANLVEQCIVNIFKKKVYSFYNEKHNFVRI
jgi:hypothetical protein